MNLGGLPVVVALAVLWAAPIVLAYWLHTRRARDQRRHEAIVERIQRRGRTWTGGAR